MDLLKDELKEAKRQIDSTLYKLRETIKTFEAKENTERYKSQITQANRRVQTFEIANWFIENPRYGCYCGTLQTQSYSVPYIR